MGFKFCLCVCVCCLCASRNIALLHLVALCHCNVFDSFWCFKCSIVSFCKWKLMESAKSCWLPLLEASSDACAVMCCVHFIYSFFLVLRRHRVGKQLAIRSCHTSKSSMSWYILCSQHRSWCGQNCQCHVLLLQLRSLCEAPQPLDHCVGHCGWAISETENPQGLPLLVLRILLDLLESGWKERTALTLRADPLETRNGISLHDFPKSERLGCPRIGIGRVESMSRVPGPCRWRWWTSFHRSKSLLFL